MTFRYSLVPAIGSALLAGCVVGPDYVRPEAPSSEALQRGAFLRADDVAASTPLAQWWEELEDPILSGLVETGLAQSPAIRAATARIREARSSIASARAAPLPSLSTSATYIYADFPNQAFGTAAGATDFVTFGFDTQWEADLWGGGQRNVERVRADAGAAEARLADVQVSLSAEIARTYVMLRVQEASAELLNQRRERDAQLLTIEIRRHEGGTANAQAVSVARQRLGHTDAEVAALGSEAMVLRDALAVLTGSAPGMMDNLPVAKIPLPPKRVAVGDPGAMLARRPDILAAERQLAASTAGIGVSMAHRFPTVSLLGLIGIGGSSIDDVFDASQLSTIAVPRLSWNFLDFGQGAANVRRAKASRDVALADYQASVLEALRDAERSLSQFGARRIALAKAVDSLQQSREASRLERLRGEAGTISNAQVLVAENREVDAHLTEINARANLTLAYVALAKSLGLGWQKVPAAKD